MSSSPLRQRIRSLSPALSLAGMLAAGSGCAGPHTPLGAVWSLSPKPEILSNENPDVEVPDGPRIHFSPRRQILHAPSRWQIVVEDPNEAITDYDLRVRYRGYDVTRSLLARARIESLYQERKLVVEAGLRLDRGEIEHPIEVAYRGARGMVAVAHYEPPTCSLFERQSVLQTGDFEPSPALLRKITDAAHAEGFNPAVFAGLIAQESGFNPGRVSWAKALGLTQITTSAEKEVAARRDDWPRYPSIETMSVEKVRMLILLGKLNSRNEWRLDPSRSVQGGVDFTRILAERWSTPANLARIRATFPNPEVAFTELVLASYHSGFARVQAALEARGKDWLHAPDLREARWYVARVSSYCDHFAEKEGI